MSAIKRLTDIQKIQVVEKYESGLSSVEIGREFGITHVSILSLLKRRGIEIRKQKKGGK